MCGITGIMRYGNSSELDENILISMRDTMIHRGPDGGDCWVSGDRKIGLAHRRLSIIDLSATATQPMSNEDGLIWITFNGEIYNHLSLRKQLLKAGHHFKTDHSDTEVLIHGYEQWGLEGLLKNISGDFAFAIWDERKQLLSLARDRAGVKPLYFHAGAGQFTFGSEIKAILADASVPRDVEPVAMYHYLSFMTTPAPMTMFRGVYKLPAGHCMTISRSGDITATRYWDSVPLGNAMTDEVAGLSDSAKEAFYVKEIRCRLERSVDRRMMSDVPFGVFLSGGVDSSTNVALMSRLMDRPVDSFTVGFKDHQHLNELEYADQIAAEFNTNHHQILIDESDMVGYLDQLFHDQDEPIADWVCIPLYFVSKLARSSGVTVIQVGEGADEQFCGYAGYMAYLKMYHNYWRPFQKYVPKPFQHLASGLASRVVKAKPGLANYADVIERAARNREHFWSGATVFWDNLKRELVNASADWSADIPSNVLKSGLLPETYLQTDSFNVISSFLDPFDKDHPGQDALTRMIYNEFKLRLPELLLMRVDKITMSESLEARVPFLDHELIEFTMNIPEEWKTRNGTAKYLLKKAVEGVIPDNVIYRKKMGFGAPMAQWLLGDFGHYVEQTIKCSGLLKRGYLNLTFIERLFDDHRNQRQDASVYIWTLFNLTSWYDLWIGQNAPASAAARY